MAESALGDRLRTARKRRGLSLRDLAARVGVSASLLSQVENGKSQASVTNLHALVTALGISLDELFDHRPPPGGAASTGSDDEVGEQVAGGDKLAAVQSPGSRPTLEMASGVTWERLSWLLPQLIDAQLVTYDPGSSSSSDGRQTRHNGTEFAYLIDGELTLKLGYDEHVLRAGDSLSFDSTTPHLYANHTDRPARGVWFEVGRRVPGGLERDWVELAADPAVRAWGTGH